MQSVLFYNHKHNNCTHGHRHTPHYTLHNIITRRKEDMLSKSVTNIKTEQFFFLIKFTSSFLHHCCFSSCLSSRLQLSKWEIFDHLHIGEKARDVCSKLVCPSPLFYNYRYSQAYCAEVPTWSKQLFFFSRCCNNFLLWNVNNKYLLLNGAWLTLIFSLWESSGSLIFLNSVP